MTFCEEACEHENSEDSERASVIKQYLTAFHGVCQALQLPVGDGHVVLAHGSVLEAPALAVVVDQLGRFAGEKQGFLVVLLAKEDVEYGLWRQRSVTNSSTLAKYLNFSLVLDYPCNKDDCVFSSKV